jgi:hypothetical protein
MTPWVLCTPRLQYDPARRSGFHQTSTYMVSLGLCAFQGDQYYLSSEKTIFAVVSHMFHINILKMLNFCKTLMKEMRNAFLHLVFVNRFS